MPDRDRTGTVNVTGIVYGPQATLYFGSTRNLTIKGNAAQGISGALILADLVSGAYGAINVDASANGGQSTSDVRSVSLQSVSGIVPAMSLFSSAAARPSVSNATAGSAFTPAPIGASATTGIMVLPARTAAVGVAPANLLLDSAKGHSTTSALDELLSHLDDHNQLTDLLWA